VTDDEVIRWYDERFNQPVLFSKKQIPVTIDTSLSTGRYPWASETGADIMNEYFERFQVDHTDFDFYRYWPVEQFILYALCGCGEDDDEPEPLTIKMLAESARAGKWLYN
jgi:hypothetical protein